MESSFTSNGVRGEDNLCQGVSRNEECVGTSDVISSITCGVHALESISNVEIEIAEDTLSIGSNQKEKCNTKSCCRVPVFKLNGKRKKVCEYCLQRTADKRKKIS
jgi:hypothetical protein